VNSVDAASADKYFGRAIVRAIGKCDASKLKVGVERRLRGGSAATLATRSPSSSFNRLLAIKKD
jgi:hypothetical protein